MLVVALLLGVMCLVLIIIIIWLCCKPGMVDESTQVMLGRRLFGAGGVYAGRGDSGYNTETYFGVVKNTEICRPEPNGSRGHHLGGGGEDKDDIVEPPTVQLSPNLYLPQRGRNNLPHSEEGTISTPSMIPTPTPNSCPKNPQSPQAPGWSAPPARRRTRTTWPCPNRPRKKKKPIVVRVCPSPFPRASMRRRTTDVDVGAMS